MDAGCAGRTRRRRSAPAPTSARLRRQSTCLEALAQRRRLSRARGGGARTSRRHRDRQHEQDQERRERVARVPVARCGAAVVGRSPLRLANATTRAAPGARLRDGDAASPRPDLGWGCMGPGKLDAAGADFVDSESSARAPLDSGLAALEGKRAIVTGASSGIGAATAQALADAGARVVTGSRRDGTLDVTDPRLERAVRRARRRRARRPRHPRQQRGALARPRPGVGVAARRTSAT